MAQVDVAELLEQAGVTLQSLGGFGNNDGVIDAGPVNGQAVRVSISADGPGGIGAGALPVIVAMADVGASALPRSSLVSDMTGRSEALTRSAVQIDVGGVSGLANAETPVWVGTQLPVSGAAPDDWTVSDIRPRSRSRGGVNGFGALEIASARGGLR